MTVLQGSPEWFLERCGCATASEFSSVLAKGEGKTREKYKRKVVTELITGKPVEGFRNGNTDRGTEQEPFAGLAYEARFGEPIQRVGFIRHKTLRAGCSPDGLISKNGGCEFKSVIPTVQLETILRTADYPPEHKAQIQGGLWITEREWWDFGSFCDDFPASLPHLRLYHFRVYRDEPYIKELEKEVRRFLDEVDELRDRLVRSGQPLEDQLKASLRKVA